MQINARVNLFQSDQDPVVEPPSVEKLYAHIQADDKTKTIIQADRHGVVYENSGFGPVNDALVTLNSRTFISTTNTDPLGKYQFFDLPRGEYIINAFSDSSGFLGEVRVQINTTHDVVAADIPTYSYSNNPPSGDGSCPYVYSFDGESYHFNGDI